MDAQKIAQYNLNFQKTVFESGYHAVCLLQDQTEKAVNTMMEQMPWIPDAGKKATEDAVTAFKNMRNDYKKAVDDGFRRLEESFSAK